MQGATVRLEPTAARWIAECGGAVMVRMSARRGCCGGSTAVPVAEPRAPADPARWLRQRTQSIDVYLDPAVPAEADTITIRAEGLWRWRRLFVDGAGLSGRARAV